MKRSAVKDINQKYTTFFKCDQQAHYPNFPNILLTTEDRLTGSSV